VASGNGSEACSLLSDAAKLSLRHGLKTVEPNTYKPTTLSCPQEIQVVHAILSSAYLSQLRNVTLGVPTVSGEGATLRAIAGSRATNVLLSKTSGGWRIDTLGVYGSTTQPPASTTPRSAPTAPIEGVEAVEHQLAAGEIRAATINKRIRAVHLMLSDGRKVLVKYRRHEEPKIAIGLRAKGVPVRIMTQAEAERDAASLRGQ
jgi:hypothetical protein